MSDKMIDALRSSHDSYEHDRQHHRFLLDAYAGTGGFRGRDQQEPSSYWGAAADIYAENTLPLAYSTDHQIEKSSYLDRFPREDLDKFKRRVSVAQYVNHVETAIDLPLSFLSKHEPTRENVTDGLREWMDDVDGDGTSWADMLREVIHPRAAAVGWCPVLFDLPAAPLDENGEPIEMSLAQAQDLGMQLRAIPLFPGHLLNWQVRRNGSFSWAKLRLYETEVDPLGGQRKLEHISVWYPDRVERWTIEHANDEPKLLSPEPEVRPHPFGRVPVSICRWKPVPNDPVRGISMIESIAQIARRHFNYQSELDEHIRQSVFAMLQVPTKTPEAGKITVGGDNALAIHPDSRREYKFVAPPSEPSEILERRLENSVRDQYRIAKIEFTLGSKAGGGQAKSGLSRAFEFETTNRTIASFAQRSASFEERSLRLASAGLGPAAAAPEDEPLTVTAAQKFNIEELLTKLDEVAAAVEIGLGKTAEYHLKLRLVDAMLPNLPRAARAQVEVELEQQAEERERQSTLATQALLGAVDEDEGPAEDAEDGDESDENAPDAQG